MIAPDIRRLKARERQRRWREEHADEIADYRALHREEINAYARQYYARNRDVQLAYCFQYQHGLLPDEYKARLTRQKGACANCGSKEPYEGRRYFLPAPDDSGQLLCVPCCRKRAEAQRQNREII